VPSPREQHGLVEASRLLQEGLQLLDERTREVDALVQHADERARELTAEAEQRAQEITAQAEQRKIELEEQIAALQSEVAEMREEMARLRSPKQGRGARPAPVAPVVAAGEPLASDPPVEAATTPGAAEQVLHDAEPTPRWGRPSTLAAQAIRRSARPRWLPRWIPFLVLLLPVGLVLANIAGPDTSAPITAQQAALQVVNKPTSPRPSSRRLLDRPPVRPRSQPLHH